MADDNYAPSGIEEASRIRIAPGMEISGKVRGLNEADRVDVTVGPQDVWFDNLRGDGPFSVQTVSGHVVEILPGERVAMEACHDEKGTIRFLRVVGVVFTMECEAESGGGTSCDAPTRTLLNVFGEEFAVCDEHLKHWKDELDSETFSVRTIGDRA